jgi:isomerase DpgB
VSEMRTEPERTELPGGLGVVAHMDGARRLPELTAAVNDLCDRVENLHERMVVVLKFRPAPDADRQWPGAVTIAEVSRWERAVRRVERLGSATITAVQGTCGGPVLDVLLATDFRIGTPEMRLVLPVNDGHFWPGMSVFRLVQHLGLARARRIVLWGTDIPAVEATSLGIVDQISEDLTGALHTAAVLCGRLSDPEIAVRRRLLQEAASVEYEDALGAHLAACDRELRRLGAPAVSGEPA